MAALGGFVVAQRAILGGGRVCCGDDLAGGVVHRMVPVPTAVLTARREVIVLVDPLDLRIERTARQLGIGVRAATGRLHRARRALATLLEQPGLRGSA
jgi:hypothetical protein